MINHDQVDTSDPVLDELKQICERLSRIEQKLASIERSARPGYVERLRRIFRPTLFNLYHYDPRPLHVPTSYLRTTVENGAPNFAIVTPTFNQARFLEATIKSVLDQNYPHLSYLVKDGGSDDSTTEVLRVFGSGLKWTSAPDAGQADAINRGFAQVDGEIMAYLNGDDLLLPGSLAYVASAFQRFPSVDVVYGHRVIIDTDGNEIGRWVLPPHDPKAIKWADFIPQETMFWRRRVWDKIGGFDASLKYALDWDFILRAQQAGFRFCRLPRFLACFRVHPDQKTTKDEHVGEAESRKLRMLHLGFDPPPGEIHAAIRSFLRRQAFFHRMYKIPIFRY